jgi:hypothetical protein
MKFFFIFLAMLSVGFSCRKKEVAIRYGESENVQSLPPPIIFEDVSHFYDSIEPPQLLRDSALLIAKLREQLTFINKLENNGNSQVALAIFKVTEDGNAVFESADALDAIKSDISGLAVELLTRELSQWKPAHVKKGPFVNVPFKINMYFFIHPDAVNFALHGPEGRILFKTKLRRPF